MKNKLEIPKDLKERNIWFESLTTEEKAVVVCQDAIQQINTRKFTAENCVYLRLTNELDFNSKDINLQEVLENQESCNVCAIGAVFASKVRLGNSVLSQDINKHKEYSGYWHLNNFEKHLDDIFEEDNLRLMEVAFEGYDAISHFQEHYSVYYNADEPEDNNFDEFPAFKDAIDFHNSYSTSEATLLAILNNVIDNKGVFIP